MQTANLKEQGKPRKRILADPHNVQDVKLYVQRPNVSTSKTQRTCVCSHPLFGAGMTPDRPERPSQKKKKKEKLDQSTLWWTEKKKNLHQSDIALTSSDHARHAVGPAAPPPPPPPRARSSRRSVPIESLIDLSRPQTQPRRSEIEQAPFWILDRRPVLIRPE